MSNLSFPITDFSHHDGPIDWDLWAATVGAAQLQVLGRMIAIIRIGDEAHSAQPSDTQYAANVQGCESRNIAHVDYVFARPELRPASAAAKLAIDAIAFCGSHPLAVCSDQEWTNTSGNISPEDRTAWCREYIQCIESSISVPCWGYGSASFWSEFGAEWPFDVCWAARYPSNNPPPDDPAAWQAWIDSIHRYPRLPRGAAQLDGYQFSSSGNGAFVGAGRPGAMDCSVFVPDTFGAPAPIPVPTEPPIVIFVRATLDNAVAFLSDASGPTLQRGSIGDEVTLWQWALRICCEQPELECDGDFGPHTSYFTKNFQEFFGLEADGIVGRHTKDMMHLVIASWRSQHSI